MREIFTILLLSLVVTVSGQQKLAVSGHVKDEKTKQLMMAVNVGIDGKGGAITDNKGNFTVFVEPGKHIISFSFVGYETFFETVSVSAGNSMELNVEMQVSTRILDEVVVSAGRYEQKLSDVTVSMEIIKTEQLSNQNITSLNMILEKTSGIEILDGQASIRGGSGYSYGAGSRVLMVVDDMPMISGDAGDIKWSYLPVENISQVEVIKGASSVLYGSAALNGVIHLRNKFPGNVPSTEVTMFSGIYMKPKRQEMVWWDRSPVFVGATISHLRKIGNLDVMFSGNYYQDEGYRELESEKRGRGNLNLRYRFKKVTGLTAGLSSSIMYMYASDFLLWQDSDSGAYRQNPTTYFPYFGLRYNLDPYLEYNTGKGGKHSLKTRLFTIENANTDKSKSSYSRTLYADYRYQKNFQNGIVWSNGTSLTRSIIDARLLNNHNSANYAAYSQLDARLGERIKVSGGVRWEINLLDGKSFNALPVLRTGINYRVAEATFLRGSLGQGYRFPSLAEKYASTEVGGLRIFPNVDLNPEKGWSAEIGVKQGLSFGNWKAYADLALFQTRYSEMIEYNFGMYLPDSVLIPSFKYLGFKAMNIGNAKITGAEFTIMTELTYNLLIFRIISGYTYMNPIDLDKLEEVGLEPDAYILKFRHKHVYKADFEAETKRFLFGANLKYTSRMVNVDEVFVDPAFGNLFLPGYPDYRKNNNSAYIIMDMRLAWKINKFVRINLIARNLLNKEYIGRPGDIGAPRNITLQARIKF